MLLIFVVPRFAALFQTLDVPLPSTTVMLVNLSDIMRYYWWLILLLLFGSVAGMVVYLKTPRGMYFRDVALLRIPGAGGIAKNFATARIIGLLGVLMAASHPPSPGLEVGASRRWQTFDTKNSWPGAEDHVTRGEPLNMAFSQPDLVSPSVQEAIRSGEESGQIDQLLLNISSFLDEENEVVVRSLTSIIEPVILIVMGLLVGLVAVCMFPAVVRSDRHDRRGEVTMTLLGRSRTAIGIDIGNQSIRAAQLSRVGDDYPYRGAGSIATRSASQGPKSR